MLQILLIFGSMFGYRAPLVNKIDPRCLNEDYVRAWVYFTDKGVTTDKFDKVMKNVKNRMPALSLMRRTMRNGVVDYGDIPLYEDYIAEIEALGGIPLSRSKWLNAASFLLNRKDLEKIGKLNFVYRITPVARFKRIEEKSIEIQNSDSLLTDRQLKMFNIDSLHRIGVFGSNVRIGFLDTGLRRRHTALDSVKVIAEYDFLGGDQIFVEDNPISEKSGLYTSMLFHHAHNYDYIFLIGSTTTPSIPFRDIYYTYSTDGGMNWQDLKKLTSTYNWATELAICGDDTMFIFYRDRYGIKYLVMTDTTVIQQSTAITTGFGYREPTAVSYNDTVYLFYENKHKLYLRKGNISGFPTEILFDTASSNIKSPKTSQIGQGISVFYNTFSGDSIYFLWDSIPLDSPSLKKFTGLYGKDVQAITTSDTIFLIYKDTKNIPLFRVGFARSFDRGNTFTTQFLSGELNSLGKISMAKYDDTVMVTWESEGKIYFYRSTDNGNSFFDGDSVNKNFVYLPTLGIFSYGIRKFYCQRGDENTDGYNPLDKDYHHPRHGTEMLGLVGGYSVDNYIGVAPGAQFIVAKTENPDSLYEFPSEEDTYIAGLEWAESKGADIISSSLGYTDWYEWNRDYDGRTSPASIAVYEATRRGVIVVTASGNVAMPQLVIPGDAFGAITVGGIDTLFERWRYSGYGPTFDGRIKPELVSLAAAPVVVEPDSINSYLLSIGTSGATAIVSGICALLLEGHPNWNVDSIRDALFKTARYADSPTDSLGYGWPDAVEAFNYTPPVIPPEKESKFLTPFPNPFTIGIHDYIYLPFFLNTKTYVEFYIYSISGRLIKKEERLAQLAPGRYTDTKPNSPNAAFIWDGKDSKGNYVASGIYYCLLHTLSAGDDITKIVVVR